MPITPDLFTIVEAAEMLGVAHSTLRDAIRNKRLTVVAIDKRTNAVTRAEIERYRAEHLGRRFGHDPNKPPTKGAEYSRRYRERLKARRQAGQERAAEPPGLSRRPGPATGYAALEEALQAAYAMGRQRERRQTGRRAERT
jgi:excisionase family DNA binding protein